MKTIHFVTLFMVTNFYAQNLKFNCDNLRIIIKNQIELLDLSEKQKIQFKELNVKFLSELEIIKNSNKAKFEKLKDLKKVRDKRDDQLKLLLNENQFKTHKEKQKQSKVKTRGELRKCIN